MFRKLFNFLFGPEDVPDQGYCFMCHECGSYIKTYDVVELNVNPVTCSNNWCDNKDPMEELPIDSCKHLFDKEYDLEVAKAEMTDTVNHFKIQLRKRRASGY